MISETVVVRLLWDFKLDQNGLETFFIMILCFERHFRQEISHAVAESVLILT